MKKTAIILIICILLLVACSPGGNGACEKGVCIDVGFRGRIQEWGTTTTLITITTDHDISGMKVSLLLFPNMSVIRSLSAPDGAEIIFQDERNLTWQFNVFADEEYTITAEIEILPPKYSVMTESDTAKYEIQASTQFPGVDFLPINYGFYLNYLGQEVEPGERYGAEGPAYILTEAITVMPGPTGVIEPTAITPTPRITPSATIDSYPPPVESMFSSTEEALPTGYP
jgi:hypothetical protein